MLTRGVASRMSSVKCRELQGHVQLCLFFFCLCERFCFCDRLALALDKGTSNEKSWTRKKCGLQVSSCRLSRQVMGEECIPPSFFASARGVVSGRAANPAAKITRVNQSLPTCSPRASLDGSHIGLSFKG